MHISIFVEILKPLVKILLKIMKTNCSTNSSATIVHFMNQQTRALSKEK